MFEGLIHVAESAGHASLAVSIESVCQEVCQLALPITKDKLPPAPISPIYDPNAEPEIVLDMLSEGP